MRRTGLRRVVGHAYGGLRRVVGHAYGGLRRVVGHAYGGLLWTMLFAIWGHAGDERRFLSTSSGSCP
ncbi:MAG: hypothetical protein ACYCTE_08345 [Acidimicrobiales bacterium]